MILRRWGGRYQIPYSFFRTPADFAEAGYRSPAFYSQLAAPENQEAFIFEAADGALNPTDPYATLFSNVLLLDFSEATAETGIITFAQFNDDDGQSETFVSGATSAAVYTYRGAPAAVPYTPARELELSRQHGDVFFNLDHDSSWVYFVGESYWDPQYGTEPGTIGFKVILEEISHALGIDSVDNIGGGGFAVRNPLIDNHKYTVTSYNPHPEMYYESDEGVRLGAFPSSLGIFDIAALQSIYGPDTTTRNEDLAPSSDSDNPTGTTYSLGKGLAANPEQAFLYTIWDAGGSTDIIDAAGFLDGVQIDLRPGHFSSIGRNGHPDGNTVIWDDPTAQNFVDRGNVGIAFGVDIENARGSDNDDYLYGNDLDNTFIGGLGSDTLNGHYGYDIADYTDNAEGIDVQAPSSTWTVTVMDGSDSEDTLLNIDRVLGADSYADDVYAAANLNRHFDAQGQDEDGADSITVDGSAYEEGEFTNEVQILYQDTELHGVKLWAAATLN